MKSEILIDRLQLKVEKRIQFWLENSNPLYIPIKYIFEAGGKRIRPIITLLSAESVGGKVQNVLDIAVAIEFLHTFTLIHDDIMDHSGKRRGLKTIHKKWGENVAILAGDYLSGLSFNTIISVSNKQTIEVLKIFTNAYLTVCEGQNEDMDFMNKEFVTMNNYLEMIKKKTAVLISASAEIGALAGGGTKLEIEALKNFGLNLGMAFQIKDDILDIVGNENKLGKPKYQDIFEGKKTYLFTKALEMVNRKEKKLLIELYNKKPVTREFVNKIKKLYFNLGIIDIGKAEVAKYADIARKNLDVLGDTEAKSCLIMLIDKITSRNY